MSYADLHLHTTASDGRLSPRALVRLAARKGIKVIAVTDHDSTEGIDDALDEARFFPELTVIPGVEISTDVKDGEVHLLGYYVDHEDANFQALLARQRDSREIRGQKMVARLAELGIRITWQRVKELAGTGAVGRPHVAQAMLERGYVSSIPEAFNKYIGRTGPAYVEREKRTPPEATRIIVEARGLPVLAHPADVPDLEELVRRLVEAGLIGLEAYYGSYTEDTRHSLLELVGRYGLIATGGSDFHGFETQTELQPGAVDVPEETVRRLMEMARQRARGLARR